jgi:hypothetical protein
MGRPSFLAGERAYCSSTGIEINLLQHDSAQQLKNRQCQAQSIGKEKEVSLA